jgi:transcriptional regulator with XRE-family HTH domain
MTYFGTNLKKIRQIKGLSQQAFAELIDLNRGVISSYEEGRAEPKIETLLRIATYFGISTDDIISKPLTVNQLANFNLVEDSVSSFSDENNPFIKQITSNGASIHIDLQKILAQFDSIYIVDETLANKSLYKKDSVLFLKEITNNSEPYNSYLSIEKGSVFVSNSLPNSQQNFAIVGVLGNNSYTEENQILQRLLLLENKVFGK